MLDYSSDMLTPTYAPSPRVSASRAQRGISLVELMVSITIGLIITAAVAQTFIANRATYQLDEGLARMQENARFAIDFLNREIRQAGNMGCVRDSTYATSPPVVDFSNNLNPPGNFNGVPAAITGFEAPGTGTGQTFSAPTYPTSNSITGWIPALDSTLIPGGALPGTDAIVIRRASTGSIPIGAPVMPGDISFQLARPDSGNQFQEGQLVILTDCESTSLYQITAIDPSRTIITHAAGTTPPPGNACETGNPNVAGCGPGDQKYTSAEVMSIQTVALYVALNANRVPALYMSGQELVEGVENMQIMYGVNNVADNSMYRGGDPDRYMTANEVNTAGLWGSVVNVRISLLMRTSNTTGSVADTTLDTGTYLLLGNTTINPEPDDNRRRQVFSTTIALRNRGV